MKNEKKVVVIGHIKTYDEEIESIKKTLGYDVTITDELFEMLLPHSHPLDKEKAWDRLKSIIDSNDIIVVKYKNPVIVFYIGRLIDIYMHTDKLIYFMQEVDYENQPILMFTGKDYGNDLD